MPFFGLLAAPVRPAPVRPAPNIRPGTGLPPGLDPWTPGALPLDPFPVEFFPRVPGWIIPDPSAPGAWPPPLDDPLRPKLRPGIRGDGPDYPMIGPPPNGVIRRPLSLYPTYPGTPIPKISIGPAEPEPERRPFTDPRVIPRNPKRDVDAGVPETHPCRAYKEALLNNLREHDRSINQLSEAARLMTERGNAARRNPNLSPECLADLMALMAEIERAARELRNLSTQNAWDIYDMENTPCQALMNGRGTLGTAGERAITRDQERHAIRWDLQVRLWDLQHRLNALLELCLGPARGARAAFVGLN